jgi:general secretion pathway protein D
MPMPWKCLLSVILIAAPALAQPAPPRGTERRINPTAPVGAPAEGTGSVTPVPAGAKKPNCEELRRKARYNIYFDKVEIEKLVQTVSDATCKTFILPENIRGKISIIGPENGKVEVNGEQFYAAFLAALDANSLAVYEHGRFLKIVDKQRAKQFPIPTLTDPTAEYTTNEQMVTKMFKVKYVEIEQLRGVLQQLVTPSGDTIPFQPDTIIINDLGSNMHRLEKVVEQLDSRSSSDQVQIIQIQYATAQEIADKVQKLFESKTPRPGQRPGNIAAMPPPPGASAAAGQPPAGVAGAAGADTGGPSTLSQLIPDERTNKLIIIASPAAMERIFALIREIDIPISGGEGKINVYYLENANAEDVASTLQSLAQGTANRPKTPPGAPAGAKPATAAELFAGEVKVSADKPTNSLVIIANQNDYRSLVRVIEKLDIQRKQVFIEAVIMEVNLDRNSDIGVNLHSGLPIKDGNGNTLPALIGTNTGKAGPAPSMSLASLASFGGFLAGIQGPVIPELQKLGLQIPSFGVILTALQSTNDVNVLSTPHLLTTDNEDAEITVGQNVPFQSGFSTSPLSSLGNIPGLPAGLGSALGGGGGTPFGSITRTNVDLKLTVKPQINESDYVRMVIQEQIEEIASIDPVLGPTTSKRSAKTTVIAKDQETIVIGGIMQDRTLESATKVPLLGDIPLLGHLFRSSSKKKVKTNLLLFLTPYIIRDSSDFRRIFERKMKERQQFVEQFYGQVTGYDVAIDFSRKPGPLARMTQVINKESMRLENGGPGISGEKLISPGTNPKVPPGPVSPPTPGSGAAPAPVAPPTPGTDAPAAVTPSPTSPIPAQPAPQAVPPVERLQVQPSGEDAR